MTLGTFPKPALTLPGKPWLDYFPGDAESYRNLVAWREGKLKPWSVPANHFRILFLNCLHFLDARAFVDLWSEIAGVLRRDPGRFVEDLYTHRMVEIGLHDNQITFEIFERHLQKPAFRALLDHLVDYANGPMIALGPPLPGIQGLVAKWMERFFDDEMDPRDVAIRILMDFCGTFGFPKAAAHARRLPHDGPEVVVQTVFGPDPDFQASIWYDDPLYDARTLALHTMNFGLPRALRVRVPQDTRPLEYVLRDRAWKVRNERVYLDGMEIGEVQSFLPFWKRNGWDFGGAPIPDVKVVLATRDWRCPATGRVLWHAGTVYGAPFFTGELWYHPMTAGEKAAYREELRIRFSGPPAEPTPTPEASQLEERFRAVQSLLAHRIDCFKFNRASDHLYLGSERFARGPVARILVYMLREKTRTGRTEFSNTSLKYDTFITDNPKTTGFETYLKRLQVRLHTRSAHVRLDLSRRGVARLDFLGPSEFQEN